MRRAYATAAASSSSSVSTGSPSLPPPPRLQPFSCSPPSPPSRAPPPPPPNPRPRPPPPSLKSLSRSKGPSLDQFFTSNASLEGSTLGGKQEMSKGSSRRDGREVNEKEEEGRRSEGSRRPSHPHNDSTINLSSPSLAPLSTRRASYLPPTTGRESSLSSSGTSIRPPPTILPPFLLPFLPPSSQPPTSITTSTPIPTPAVAYLPPPPPRSQVKLLSELSALLPLANWTHHALISNVYHALNSNMLNPRIHRQVALQLSRAPRGTNARNRLLKAVERLKEERIEPPKSVQVKLIKLSVGLAPTNDGRGLQSEVEAWNLLFGDIAPFDEPTDSSLWNRRLSIKNHTPSSSALRPPSTPTYQAVNEMLRSPNLSSSSFQSVLAFSPAPRRHLGPLVALASRNYTLVSNLPALLQDPRAGELNTEALNQIMHTFAMDEKLDLTVALEAYAAFRRHAAGYHWRRVYIERAAQGLYQNYDDPTISYANPILDSLGYNFPPGLAPTRQTYTMLLRACLLRGNLNLALVVFKDMLNPNGMSLRIPGSKPGPAQGPPTLLETFLPGLIDYTAFFVGFFQHGQTEGLDPDQRFSYDEARGVLLPPQEGGGKEDSQTRLWRKHVREETSRIWEVSMGFEETGMLQDPYTPEYTGDFTGRKQFAVNLATEHRRWELKTLIIVFRSFLNLCPNGEIIPPNPLPSYLPPAPPRFLPSSSLAPHPRRIYWILRAFAVTTNYNPHVLRSAWDVLEGKFGPGNEEGWIGWRVGRETVDLMNAVGAGEGIRVSGPKWEAEPVLQHRHRQQLQQRQEQRRRSTMVFTLLARRTASLASIRPTSVRFLSISPASLQINNKPVGEKTVADTVSETVDSVSKKASELLQSARSTVADATATAKNEINADPSLPNTTDHPVQNLAQDAKKAASNAYLDGEKAVNDIKTEGKKAYVDSKAEIEKK